MRKFFALVWLLFLSVSLLAGNPKYVFYLIGDGMGLNCVCMTDSCLKENGEDGLSFCNFPFRSFVSTNPVGLLVTDSAASGTALSCGGKTINGMLGVNPAEEPMVSVAEKAMRSGYAAGVVTSVGVNHATPAAFYAHVRSRKMYDEIFDQYLESGIEFAAGGGILLSKHSPRSQKQCVEIARNKGINVFLGKNEYKESKGRVLYLGDEISDSDLPYAIDRPEGATSLADFTSAAISHLYSVSRKGFFLMIEGGKIDYAMHANDAATGLQETVDFDEALACVLDFYEKHPHETLIIVTADHETGGLTSSNFSGKPGCLSAQTGSIGSVSKELRKLHLSGKEVSWTEVKGLLQRNFGLWTEVDVDPEEELVLKQLYADTFLFAKNTEKKDLYSKNYAIAVEAARYLARISGYEFGSNNHTAAEVGLWVKGDKAFAFSACSDNTHIAPLISSLAGYR